MAYIYIYFFFIVKSSDALFATLTVIDMIQ